MSDREKSCLGLSCMRDGERQEQSKAPIKCSWREKHVFTQGEVVGSSKIPCWLHDRYIASYNYIESNTITMYFLKVHLHPSYTSSLEKVNKTTPVSAVTQIRTVVFAATTQRTRPLYDHGYRVRWSKTCIRLSYIILNSFVVVKALLEAF